MPRKKQVWQAGDIFAVPLGDGRFGLGQIICEEKERYSALCAFFSRVIEHLDEENNWKPHLNELIAVQITTRDLLDYGEWKIIGNSIPIEINDLYPIQTLRENNYIGAVVESSRAIVEFFKAYHGLIPWDRFYDPEYFDKLLAPGVKRPPNVIFKKDIKQ